MDVASIPLLASSCAPRAWRVLFTYRCSCRFVRRGERHSLFHMVQHLAHVRERVVLSVAHHRVVLALCNLSHIVALLDLSFSFRHFLPAFI